MEGLRGAGRAGFVLAGGKSSRMGRDKALLPYRGMTLIEYVASQVAEAAGSATIAGHTDRYRAFGYRTVEDNEPGCGPLGGIRTVLAITEAPWNLVVACDMPGVTAAFLGILLERAEQCGGDCLIPASPGGRLEPLCAVYHRSALARLTAAAGKTSSMRDAVAGPEAVIWPVSDAAPFHNLNTPEDLRVHGLISQLA